MRYLLVDDNPIDLLVNEKVIKNHQPESTITKVNNGLEALNFLKNCQDSELPHIILLDIKMPLMDGFQFLDSLKELPGHKIKSIKIYMVSSSIDPADVKRSRENHLVKDFIEKPLSKSDFLKNTEA